MRTPDRSAAGSADYSRARAKLEQIMRRSIRNAEILWQDLRFGLRTLLKRPGFTAVVALTLALGIGANSAIFSVVNAVLLRRLPFKEPDRLVMVWKTNLSQSIQSFLMSAPDFIDFRDQNQVFEDIAATSTVTFTITGQSHPEQIYGAWVSPSFFSLLGVTAAAGRTFVPGEDEPSHRHVVVVSYGLWQRRFGSAPDVIGKTLTLSGINYKIIGIAPRAFQFPPSFDNQGGLIPWTLDIWVPLDVRTKRLEGFDLSDRGNMILEILARLKPGVTLQQARSNMETINRRLQSQYPVTNKAWGVAVVPLKEQLVGDIQRALLVLLGGVAFVLLIACANAANLLLARAAARQKEIAIRMALGAGRARLIRQLLTESVLLALLGGALGLALAHWGGKLLIAVGPESIPRLKETGLDGLVLGFGLVLSLATGLLFGLAPALQTSKSDLNDALKEGGRSGGSSLRRQRVRTLLVVSQVALALVLLIGAGLMIKSFLRLQAVNPGLAVRNILTVKIKPNRMNYPEDHQRVNLYKQVVHRVEALPGVQAAGAISIVPLSEGPWTFFFEIEGRPRVAAAERPVTNYLDASPSYFNAMGIPLLKGRYFTEHDGAQNPRVAMINHAMMRRFFPSEDPIGKRINLVDPPGKPVWLEIVGVVGDVKEEQLDREAGPDVYTSYLQPYPEIPNTRTCLVIRTTVDPSSMAALVRREVLAVDNDQPVYDIKPMERYLAESISKQRLYMLLLGVFGAVALLLAVGGVYGVISYVVAQRTNEIGIRIALGAQAHDIIKLIVGEGMVVAGIGLAIGVAAALTLTRTMSSLLYGLNANDPTVFIAISLLLAGAAFAATYIPARRSTRIDPTAALRYE